MARTVLVVTDRPMFAASCQSVLAAAGVRARVVAPSDVASVLRSDACAVFDSDSDAYRDQEDELLVALGFARALHATSALACSSPRGSDLDDLAADLCPGLISNTAEELRGLVSRMIKQAEGRETPRFEYVTVSPREAELLVILSNGHAVLLARPCAGDDGSDVTSIDLAADAASANVTLASGAGFVLLASAVAPRSHHASNGASHANTLSSANVGSRLRELRKAAGLTQAELARRTNIHRPNIARVEAGRHTPSLDTLARIADAIGVPVTRVLSAD
jgi:DNA-binding XRE family transcriptional regulator